MRQPGRIPHWRDMKTMFGGFFALVLAVVGIAMMMPFASWVRSNWANAATPPEPAPIDGERAYKYLKEICAIGPRPAGSEANARQRAMVSAHFTKLGGKVTEQKFTGEDPRTGRPVAMVNLVGSWHPERKERVVLGAHYDTRPFPDEERNPAKRSTPFIGANDGASGVALLMEIAHHLNDLSTPWGVDLVLFDGEELVYGQDGEYFLGSKEFGRRYSDAAENRRSTSRYAAGMVLDMVGGKDLSINQEPYSLDFAPRLVRDVWDVARQLKATAFRNRVGRAVMDDHLPLNQANIPTIDVIDFDYPYWHTADDLPENCSAASLAQVGRVITAWLTLPKTRQRSR